MFSVYLQMMETFPTCLRQSGMSFGLILGNLLGIFGPYIVFLVFSINLKRDFLFSYIN